MTGTSGTNNTAAPEGHRLTTEHSTATSNQGGTPRQTSGTPASRQKRSTLLAFRFPRFHRLCRATGNPPIESRGVLLPHKKQPDRTTVDADHIRLDKGNGRCRHRRACRPAAWPGPAVYSMIALGRSRIVGGRVWEPCNRCDVLRHIVRSQHAWQPASPSYPGHYTLARAYILCF